VVKTSSYESVVSAILLNADASLKEEATKSEKFIKKASQSKAGIRESIIKLDERTQVTF
jgi:hypothetical protein